MTVWVKFLFDLISALIKVMRPNGITSLAAENVVLKKQLMILKRQHKRCPSLRTSDRIILGCLTAWIKTKRLAKVAIIIKPITLLNFIRH